MRVRAIDLLPDCLAEDCVVMAVFPDGSQCKITGPDRARRWMRDPASAPKTLLQVLVVHVQDELEVERLHDEFEHLLGPEMM